MSGPPYQPYPGYSGQHQSSGYPPASTPLQPGYSGQRPPQQQPVFSPQPFGQQAYNQQYNRPPPPPPQSNFAYGQQPLPFAGGPYSNQVPPYAPHPGYGYGGQQQPQHGYSPQQAPQQQYGGVPPPQAGPAQIGAYKQILQACIQENNLQSFYPPNSQMIDRIAQRAVQQIDQVCGRWRIPKEVGNDLAKLGLFDIILYIDDSGSMQFEENGERISDLKLILQRVAYAATIFDDDGVSIRFMNSTPPHNLINGIRSDVQIEQLMAGIQFKGLTPMGTELKNKVIDGIVFSQQLRKPVLVITITDGQPAGEAQNAVFETIKYAVERARSNPQYGPGAIKFQFAQVGNDTKAREFLGKLDEDPMVGSLVDCTSNYENESEEMSRANPPINLTPELWLVKLLLGAIDRSYDRKDEKSNHPSETYGGYQPPQQGYGQMPQGYNQPPQQGYHAPPQQGYNQSQNWGQQHPPGQYPPQQQGGYGAPPPGQYGYGAPPGQYGGPPPPRR